MPAPSGLPALLATALLGGCACGGPVTVADALGTHQAPGTGDAGHALGRAAHDAAAAPGAPDAREDEAGAAEATVHEGTVVLLHGLGRGRGSMKCLARTLEHAGYAKICNIGYPSRRYPIEVLAREHVLPALRRCADADAPVHFVTHSMGGIVLRALAESASADERIRLGRVVMLAPPNGGSEIVDRFADSALFQAAVGPAALQLGTGPEAFVNTLERPDFALGIVAGSRRDEGLFSETLPGRDDGKVSVCSARIDGARDFTVIPVDHRHIVQDPRVHREVLRFLARGRFATHSVLPPRSCAPPVPPAADG